MPPAKSIWTQSYEMKTPIININGDYAVIADQQGNESTSQQRGMYRNGEDTASDHESSGICPRRCGGSC